MRVFVLEDDAWRMQHLGNLAQEWGWEGWTLTHLETSVRWRDFRPPYDLILLDHDLGGRQLTGHEDDGLAFVMKVRDLIPKDTPVIIHSFNPDGAARMCKALQEVDVLALVAPFGGPLWMNLVQQAYWRAREKPAQSAEVVTRQV